jgi:hypothetical protein
MGQLVSLPCGYSNLPHPYFNVSMGMMTWLWSALGTMGDGQPPLQSPSLPNLLRAELNRFRALCLLSVEGEGLEGVEHCICSASCLA